MTRKKTDNQSALDYSNIKPEEDGRPWYTPPPGWVKPTPGPALPFVQGVTQDQYDEVVRKLLLPHEKLWRNSATSSGRKKLIAEKTKPARALISSVLKIDVNGPWPTLDDCIPKGTILEAVDRYFWENTDIPRALPFFNVLHYVLAKLLQQGIVIHKGKQVILPDVWTIVVAPSGTGKTTTLRELAKAMGGQVTLFPTDANTSLQFLTYLRDYRLGLLIQDEVAQFFNAVTKDPGMRNVRGYMLKTYDNANIGHGSTASRIQVEKSAIGMIGYSIVKTLKKYLTPEMLDDGFAQRFAYFVAGRDERPIVGDMDFDDLEDVIKPMWAKIESTPFHSVYRVEEDGRGAFDRVVQIIVGRARQDDVDESFARRIAFSTYKYGLAYHILTGKTDDVISPEDLALGAQLAAMHLQHIRKVLDLYEEPKKGSSSPMGTLTPAINSGTAVAPDSTPVKKRKRAKDAPLTYEECVTLAKKKIQDFAIKGKKTDTRLLGGYVKVEAAVLRKILTELAQDPAYAPNISLPKT